MAQVTVYRCGNHSIDEGKLLAIANHIAMSQWCSHRGFKAAINEGAQISGLWIRSVDHAVVALDGMHSFNADFESLLQYAVYRYRISMSTDPRDKIYALLGFNENLTAGKQSCEPIVPDYTKSVTQVYIEATQYLLETSRNLSILSTVEDRTFRELKNLPSWVPDYSVSCTSGIGHRRWKTYSASRALKPKWQIKENGTVFSLNAMRVDTISRVGASGPEMCFAPWRCHELLSVVADMDEFYINGQTKVEAFWRTLIGDSQPTGASPSTIDIRYPAPDSLSRSFGSWLLLVAAIGLSVIWGKSNAPKDPAPVCQAITTTLNKLSRSDTIGSVPCTDEICGILKPVDPPETVGLDDDGRDHYMVALPYFASTEKFSCTRFFRTAEGFMGTGPLSLEIGDSIWLASGADVFFVLRERHGTKRFEFIGDAYVHGLMEEEALEKINRDFITVELD